MIRSLTIALITILSTSSISQAKTSYSVNSKKINTLELTRLVDIQDAQRLSDSMMTLAKKVSPCQETKKTTEECFCEHINEAKALQSLIDAVFKKHPEWKGQKLKYIDSNGNETVKFMLGFAKQSEFISKLQCK